MRISYLIVCAAALVFGSQATAQPPKPDVKKLESELEKLREQTKELESKLKKAKEPGGPKGPPFGRPPFGKFDPAKAKEMKEAFEKKMAEGDKKAPFGKFDPAKAKEFREMWEKRMADYRKKADADKKGPEKKGPPSFGKGKGWGPGGPGRGGPGRGGFRPGGTPSIEGRIDRIVRDLEELKKELKSKDKGKFSSR